MKHLYSLLSLFLLFGYKVSAQVPDWSTSVASILYNNCLKCHNNDGIAPFSVETYDVASAWSGDILTSITNHTMPPWPPDPNYRHYVNERILTQAQIDTISQWVYGGTPEGDESKAPPLPVINNGPALGPADLTLQIPTYTSNAVTADDYACFVLPLNIDEDKFVKAIQIVPGNPKIVHHVIVMMDTTASMTNQDCMIALANLPGANSATTLTSYAAGMGPTVFPSGEAGLKMGERLKKGSNIMVQIHYPEGTAGQVDSTKILFYLYSDSAATALNPPLRLINVGMYTMNWAIFIPANTTQTITSTFPSAWTITYTGSATTTNKPYSMFAVDPHMHLVGRSMSSWGITPAGDTIPFERINDWEYQWQAYYFFKNLLKLDSGSVINGTAFYDNTSNNPYNPFVPPQTIIAGENTTNEMMLIAFMFMDYQPGDENYNLDSLINLSIATYPVEATAINQPLRGKTGFTVFPNPASGHDFTLAPYNLIGGRTDVTITDVLGQVVQQLHYDNLTTPVPVNIDNKAGGIYLVQLKQGTYSATEKLVINR